MRSQLKQAALNKNGSPYRNAEYNYRKDGNLNYRTINGSTTNFTYNGDLMDTAYGGEQFDLDWDDNGSMTTGVSETFDYNWDNKLRSASALSGNIRYDPSGNRVRKQSAVVGDRKYIVDILGDLPTTLMEITDDAIRKAYIYANGQALCQHDGSHSAPLYFYTHDRTGDGRNALSDVGRNQSKRRTFPTSVKTGRFSLGKVVRGGSWYDRPKRCRSAFRLSYPGWRRVYNVGFRIVIETDGTAEHLAKNS